MNDIMKERIFHCYIHTQPDLKLKPHKKMEKGAMSGGVGVQIAEPHVNQRILKHQFQYKKSSLSKFHNKLSKISDVGKMRCYTQDNR